MIKTVADWEVCIMSGLWENGDNNKNLSGPDVFRVSFS